MKKLQQIFFLFVSLEEHAFTKSAYPMVSCQNSWVWRKSEGRGITHDSQHTSSSICRPCNVSISLVGFDCRLSIVACRFLRFGTTIERDSFMAFRFVQWMLYILSLCSIFDLNFYPSGVVVIFAASFLIAKFFWKLHKALSSWFGNVFVSVYCRTFDNSFHLHISIFFTFFFNLFYSLYFALAAADVDIKFCCIFCGVKLQPQKWMKS